MASEAIETDVSRAKKSIVAVLLAIILIVFAGLYGIIVSALTPVSQDVLLTPTDFQTVTLDPISKLASCATASACIDEVPPNDGNTTIIWGVQSTEAMFTHFSAWSPPVGARITGVRDFWWWRNNGTGNVRFSDQLIDVHGHGCTASDATALHAFQNFSSSGGAYRTLDCDFQPWTVSTLAGIAFLLGVEDGLGTWTITTVTLDVRYVIDTPTSSLASLVPFVAIGAAVMLLILSLPAFRSANDPPAPADPPAKPLGTIRRGKVKVRSPRQMRWLHSCLNEGDPRGNHTHFFYRGGRYRAVRHTVRRR